MQQTKLIHKILLINLGIIITICLLELGLHIAGVTYLNNIRHQNRRSMEENENKFIILCLGESTTAFGGKNSYPRQLESILNSRQNKIKFSVINKGVPVIRTSEILENLEHNLNFYKPQMVITMMGINDFKNRKIEKIFLPSEKFALIYKSHLYRLLEMIYVNLRYKIFQSRYEGKLPVEKRINQQIELLKSDVKVYTENDRNFLTALKEFEQKDYKDAISLLKISVNENPNSTEALSLLAYLYIQIADYESAIDHYQKLFLLNPHPILEINAYFGMAECYKFFGEYDKALDLYYKIVYKTKGKTNAFDHMGEIYLEIGDYEKAIKMLELNIKLNPQDYWSYSKLAHCYRQLGIVKKAEQILLNAINLNPEIKKLYVELAFYYIEINEYEKSLLFTEKALDVFSKSFKNQNKKIYKYLIDDFDNVTKDKQLKKLLNVLRILGENLSIETKYNYLQVKSILSRKLIPLVAVQYPLRAIEPLKDMLNYDHNVIYVDNNAIFKNFIKKNGFDYYFYDHFAGDFGHCTPKGNRLLAEKVAEAILQYVEEINNH